jgi:preprotein translocase subunit SecA
VFQSLRSWFLRLFQPGSISVYKPLLLEINALEPKIKALSDHDLAQQTGRLKERLARGASLDSLLPEAFATVRETAWRRLQMRHFDVQILGGIALYHGHIAEMKTGEGKTLVATLPAYLHALSGKGVHVITVNDYLAARDADWMGKIYRFLGLEVGVVLEDMGEGNKEIERRKAAYRADITYVTNHEVVFDYLRDHLATEADEIVQRAPHFAIVDEVDLLLIDEVRTPLIISGPAHEDTSLFAQVDQVIRKLQSGLDYKLHPRIKTATLTEEGLDKVEAALQCRLSDPEHIRAFHAVHQSVQAHGAYKRDVDYIVRKGEIQLIDEHTGRVSPDKRLADGLHQAIEAKERLRVQAEDRTFARMSYQQYFRLYPRLCGMTGTALSEKEELRQVYGLRVYAIPTHRPLQRKDYVDVVYASLREKHQAILATIEEIHETGRPILVGTTSVEESQQLGKLLRSAGLPCQILNAKEHEREAEIIAQAGRRGMITLSTNMAGRGTDILLGGDPTRLHNPKDSKAPKAPKDSKDSSEDERKAVVEAGGLFVLGTALHDSPRLDAQLRGRAGRQGDPGSSQIFLSLDDPIFAKYGEADIAAIRHRCKEQQHPEGEEINDPAILRLLHSLRKKVADEHRAERIETLKYDTVVHQQRQQIYTWRQSILLDTPSAERHRQEAHAILHETLLDTLHWVFDDLQPDEEVEESYLELEDLLRDLTHTKIDVPRLSYSQDLPTLLLDELLPSFLALYDPLLEGDDPNEQAERIATQRKLLLESIDYAWIDHLNALERLEDAVSLYGYAEQDPLVAYRKQAGIQFGALLATIRYQAVQLWFSLARPPKEPSTTTPPNDTTPQPLHTKRRKRKSK